MDSYSLLLGNRLRIALLLAVVVAGFMLLGFALQDTSTFVNDPKTTLKALLHDEDTDNDLRITIRDSAVAGTTRGNREFTFSTSSNKSITVSGTYFLSNLLQELKLLDESGRETVTLSLDRIFEKPASRISRNIREIFWDGLTRHIDEQGLPEIVTDTKYKTLDGFSYVYVPSSDNLAHNYFADVARRHPQWLMRVVRLPKIVTPQYVRSLDGLHGVLTLSLRENPDGTQKGVPFVVPGGRFNEMYGWDSYFILLGLLQDRRVELAKDMIENAAYEINHYGAILNANRTYYLTRSQPPFLTSMAVECYKHLPKTSASKQWLKSILEAAIQEYHNVWTSPDRTTSLKLNRYFDVGIGAPPEVEPGHFDEVFLPYAKQRGMSVHEFEQAYRAGRITMPELDEYFTHDRCMRESGHDTSYRLERRCAHLATVDLNSLLYRFEIDIAELIGKEFGGRLTFAGKPAETSVEWRARAIRRKYRIREFLWSNTKGMFFDYDLEQKSQTDYVSATTFYPLWARLATRSQADLLVKKVLPLLEKPGGIAASTEQSRGPISPERPLRQWDYPHGWAPHQMLVWKGLTNYGYKKATHRLIYKWLYTITRNAADYNGTVPEKFDVVNRTHEVFAEYGNVGTTFSYITREGFGWTNASFQVGFAMLTPALRDSLNELVPPENIFEQKG